MLSPHNLAAEGRNRKGIGHPTQRSAKRWKIITFAADCFAAPRLGRGCVFDPMAYAMGYRSIAALRLNH